LRAKKNSHSTRYFPPFEVFLHFEIHLPGRIVTVELHARPPVEGFGVGNGAGAPVGVFFVAHLNPIPHRKEPTHPGERCIFVEAEEEKEQWVLIIEKEDCKKWRTQMNTAKSFSL